MGPHIQTEQNMETFTIITGVIDTAVGIAALAVVLFGINFGKKFMFKSETLYGTEAEDRYNSIKDTLPKDRICYDGPYQGRNKITPQFESERFYYNPQTMGEEWKGTTKTIRYYYADNGTTMVKSWRLK
jgi:hypothetical protein